MCGQGRWEGLERRGGDEKEAFWWRSTESQMSSDSPAQLCLQGR